MNVSLSLAAGTLLLGGGVCSTLFYFASFESTRYQAGKPLAGQQDWVSLISPKAATIVRDRQKARTGLQAIQCWGGGPLESISTPYYDLLDGAWEQVVQFDADATPRVVRVQASVRLDGPDTGDGPNDDLLSANVYARNGSGRSAWFYLSSNGNAYAFANSETKGSAGYAFETPIRRGEYNELAITLDYSTHMASFQVNGKVIGSLPFGGSGEEFRGVLLEFAALDDLEWVDPADYTAYWDNVVVFGTAERD